MFLCFQKMSLWTRPYRDSAGRTRKSENWTFWVMSPPNIQLCTSTKIRFFGVRFLSVVKKILEADQAQKSDFENCSAVYHPSTGHLASIGNLPALAGWYIRLD
jgi:hypothetical protein